MYGLNAFALLAAGVIAVASAAVCGATETVRRRCLRGACLLLLLGNAVRYALLSCAAQRLIFPVELSAVSYFVVPLIFLLKQKWLYALASHAGLTAGICYYLTLFLAGGWIYGAAPHADVYLSMLFHGALLFCGEVSRDLHGDTWRQCYKQLAAIAVVSLRAALLRPWVAEPSGMLIYILLDRTPLSWLGLQTEGVAAAAFYAVLVGLTALSLALFYRSSRNARSSVHKMNILYTKMPGKSDEFIS